MKDYVITGSTGFIGSNLMKHMEKSKRVLGVTGFDKISSDLGNDFCSDENFLYLNHKLNLHKKSDFKQAKEIMTMFNKPKAVFHFACLVGVDLVKSSNSSINEVFETDMRMLDFCKKEKIKLIYTSSSEIYGYYNADCKEDFDVVLKQFNDSNIGRTDYALEKYMIERKIQTNLCEYIILRPFNIAGPGQSSLKGVIPRFIKFLLKKEKIKIYKYQNQLPTRTYCHVDDFCNIVFELQDTFDASGVFNIGNPNEEINNLELLEKIAKIMNIKPDYEVIEAKYDVLRRTPNVSKVLDKIQKPDYKFKSLDSIIEDTLVFFENNKFKNL